MTFGQTIKAARKLKKLTQENIARAMQCDRVAVSNWETDKNRPDPKKIPTLAFLLGLNSTELMQLAYPGIDYNPRSWAPEDPPVKVEVISGDTFAYKLPAKAQSFKIAELYDYIKSMPKEELAKTLKQLQVALKQVELRKAESELDDDQ